MTETYQSNPEPTGDGISPTSNAGHQDKPDRKDGWTKVEDSLLKRRDIDSTEKLVLSILIRLSVKEGFAWISVIGLAAMIGMTVKATRRAINRLAAAGHLERIKRYRNNLQITNQWVVHVQPYRTPLQRHSGDGESEETSNRQGVASLPPSGRNIDKPDEDVRCKPSTSARTQSSVKGKQLGQSRLPTCSGDSQPSAGDARKAGSRANPVLNLPTRSVSAEVRKPSGAAGEALGSSSAGLFNGDGLPESEAAIYPDKVLPVVEYSCQQAAKKNGVRCYGRSPKDRGIAFLLGNKLFKRGMRFGELYMALAEYFSQSVWNSAPETNEDSKFYTVTNFELWLETKVPGLRSKEMMHRDLSKAFEKFSMEGWESIAMFPDQIGVPHHYMRPVDCPLEPTRGEPRPSFQKRCYEWLGLDSAEYEKLTEQDEALQKSAPRFLFNG